VATPNEPLSRFFPLLGGDLGIYQTVSAAKSLVYQALRDPRILARRRAEQILLGIPERDEVAEVKALYEWVKSHFHYVNDPTNLEFIKAFDVMEQAVSHNGVFFGDCDDGSVYLASLLASVGYPVRFVIMSPLKGEGDDFKHIYLKTYLRRRDQWINLDVTAKGRPFGWSAPNRRIREFPV